MAAMIGTVLLSLAAFTTTNIDRRLRDQVSAVSTTVRVAPDGTVTALETPNDAIDDTTWVYDRDGDLVEGPHVGPKVSAVADSLARVGTRTRVEKDERVYLAAPVEAAGQRQAVVVVKASREPYESTRNAVLIGLLALGVTVTAGSAAVAAWAVRRTLAPVESMVSRAEDWSEHDLDARFDATGTKDELAHLGRTLNVLLDRVAGALRTEQRLTAELAHELRTPLTAIRGEAELARMARLSPEADARLERVMALVDRMGTTIASLLAIARGDARAVARTTSTDLLAAVTDEGPRRDGVDIVLDHARIEVPAPLDLAARALSPLVENAVEHARSQVTIAVTATGRSLEIAVTDDGPGVGADDPQLLFESGRRGIGSAGAGLGLALARRVARSLGGDVGVTSAAQPTTFTLTLPRY